MTGIKQMLVFLWGLTTGALLTAGAILPNLRGLLAPGLMLVIVAIITAAMWISEHWHDK